MSSRPPLVAGLRLLRLVGQGGEGEVWEALTAAGERRAVKLVRPEAVAPPDQVATRGDWLRRIDHPSLVRVRRTATLSEAGLVGWGLVEMDFIDGQELSSSLPRRDALQRLRTLAHGLDLLHGGAWSNGTPLVHRDIKPANLIASPEGRVVLVDCSSLCGVDRTVLTRIGTPLFAAPEVITGRIGPASDVYSFAATVVALTTGARGEALLRYLDEPQAVDLPDPVRRALDPDPSRRPRACLDMVVPQVLHLAAHPEPRSPQPDMAADGGWLPPVAPTDNSVPRVPPATSLHSPSSAPVPSTWSPPLHGGGSQAAADAMGEPPRRVEHHHPATGADVPLPPPAAVPHRAVWPFLALLAGVTLLLAGAALRPDELGVPWTVTAAALSVVAHLAAARNPWAVIAVPPVAWAFLIAERVSAHRDRQAWARATVSGVLTGALALGWVAMQQAGVAGAAELLVADVTVAFCLTAATVITARDTTRDRFWIRFALAPFTLLGALMLFAGAAITAPLTMLTDDGARSTWLARDSVRACSAIAVFGQRSTSAATGIVAPVGLDSGAAYGTLVDDDWSAA